MNWSINSRTFRPVTFNTLITVTMIMARMACQALVLVFIARLLDVEGYGIFAAVVALALIFAPLSGLGSDYLSLRAVSQTRGVERQVFKRGMLLISLSAVPLIGTISLLSLWWFPEGVSFKLIVAVLIADMYFLRCTELVAKIYQGLECFTRMGVVRLLAPLSRLFAVLILWVLPIDATPQLWAQFYLSGSVIAALIATILIFIDYEQSEGTPLGQMSLSDGLHFAGGVVSARFHTQADKAIVLVLSGAVGAGIYSAAYRIVEFTLMPVMAFITVIYGRQFQDFHQKGIASAANKNVFLILPCLLIGLLMALVLWFSLEFIMFWALGASFSSLGAGLLPLSILPIFMSLRLIGEQSVAAMRLLKERTVIQWSVAGLALVSNLIFVPLYSWIAAAWVCLGIEVLLGSFYLMITLKKRSAVK